MSAQMTEIEWLAIVSALRIACEKYREDAKNNEKHPSIALQFCDQADLADMLAVRIEEQLYGD